MPNQKMLVLRKGTHGVLIEEDAASIRDQQPRGTPFSRARDLMNVVFS
ncbi:hypothetical protein [Halarchaeum salinum]